jgi:glyceraldehyde 3-phosphate dehydrogenase
MADKTRVGLMGFGRIGRNVFRQVVDHPNIEVVAICDIADPEGLVYLLKYDTVFGRFPKPVSLDGGHLVVDGTRIPMLDAKDPGDVDWTEFGVDFVVQATRKHRSAAELRKHVEAGAKRVILASTPEDPAEIETLLMGVNDETFDPGDEMIALGSNTSNALAPVLKILEDSFGLNEVVFTVVHAFTNEGRLADVPGTGLRTSRSAAENIIPAETTSPEIISSVLPELEGKIIGMALNVPVADGSNVDLVAMLGSEATAEEINEAVKAAAADSTVVEYTEDPIVSSDVIGSCYSAVVDGLMTSVMDGTMAKMVIWFDNGWGYAARIVEAIEKAASWEEVSA